MQQVKFEVFNKITVLFLRGSSTRCTEDYWTVECWERCFFVALTPFTIVSGIWLRRGNIHSLQVPQVLQGVLQGWKGPVWCSESDKCPYCSQIVIPGEKMVQDSQLEVLVPCDGGRPEKRGRVETLGGGFLKGGGGPCPYPTRTGFVQLLLQPDYLSSV